MEPRTKTSGPGFLVVTHFDPYPHTSPSGHESGKDLGQGHVQVETREGGAQLLHSTLAQLHRSEEDLRYGSECVSHFSGNPPNGFRQSFWFPKKNNAKKGVP